VKGSTAHQIYLVYQTVKEIGTSKHDSKAQARAGGAKTWHEIGKEMGIKSYSTADAYRDVWRSALNYAKAELGIKDLEKFSGEHVKSFLESKIDDGVAHATLSQYAAALEKLEVALNRFAELKGSGREYRFSEAISEARAIGKGLERFEGSRAYARPDALAAAVRGEKFSLAVAIQREGGARVSEANHIMPAQLKGIKADPQTGQGKGWIKVQGKGGKIREVGVRPETYARLASVVKNDGCFAFKVEQYRNELKAAAAATGQEYQGSHGIRWSWAQERHQELQRSGRTYEQTIGRVSVEMGHERADITEHYLR
jgi:integrase